MFSLREETGISQTTGNLKGCLSEWGKQLSDKKIGALSVNTERRKADPSSFTGR